MSDYDDWKLAYPPQYDEEDAEPKTDFRSLTMMADQRTAATLREAARVMRTPGCTPNVLRALRCTPLTPTELCRVFRGKYRPRTIYAALQTLRLVGLAQPTGRKVRCLGSVSEIWRPV